MAPVNGAEIRESDLALAAQDIGQELQQMPPQQQREQLVAYAADVILVSQAADAKKFERRSRFQAAPGVHAQQAADGAQLQEAAKAAVTDEAEHALYETPSSRWATRKRCTRATSW